MKDYTEYGDYDDEDEYDVQEPEPVDEEL